MKKFLLFLISLSLGAALFIYVTNDIGWKEITDVFSSFSVSKAVFILILTILIALTKALRWRMILKNQGYNVSALEIFEYYISGLSISFLAPMVILGGEIFRCHDLKEKYSVPWTKSIASVIIDKILEITVFSALIIFGVAFFIFKAGFPTGKMGISIFSVIFLAILGIFIFYFKCFKKESIILAFMKKAKINNSSNGENVMAIESEIYKYFRPQKKIMWQGFLISALSGFFALARTFFLIIFFGKSVGILGSASILGFSYIAKMCFSGFPAGSPVLNGIKHGMTGSFKPKLI